MADANDASEQIKLLTDLGKTDSTLDIFRRQNDLSALAAQVEELKSNQPTQAQLNALNKEAKAQQTAFESGTGLVKQAYEKLGLSEEQGYLSQLSGELSATLDYQLRQQRDRLAARGGNEERVAAYDSALDQIAGYADSFRAQNGGRDFRELKAQEPDRVKDLATEDGFWGLVQKGATTAVAGIPGLGAIAASSFASSEDSLLGRAGQALGGLASDIQDTAPTDIGSSAASQQFQDIQARAASGEQSTLGAIGESIGLLGDGDFAGDLLANTIGAAAGGGAVRAGAGLGARALGAGAARQAGSGALNQARQAAPAIGVGLGAGVDENITPGQARLLAGTGLASAGLAGAAGLVGAQVAESAIGNTARNVAGRLTGQGAQATDDLSVAGLGGQLAAAPRGAVRTAAGEAPQEFIEGAGESLGQSAQESGQGALATLADPQARAQAIQSGTIQAPLGAGLGAAIGAPAGVSQVRAQNAANTQRLGELETEKQAIDADIASGREGAAIADQIAAQRAARPADPNVPNSGELQFQQQREAAVESVRQGLVNEIEPTPLTPEQLATSTRAERIAASQPTQQPVTLIDYLNETLANPAGFDTLIDQGPEAVENTFRALYRNEAQAGDIDPAAEDAFITRVGQIDFDNTPLGTIREQIGQAAAIAQNEITPVEAAPVEPEPAPPTEPVTTTPEPITEVDQIADDTVVPESDLIPVDPEVEGVNPATLFDSTSEGTTISETGRAQGESLRSAQAPRFQELSPGDRQAILGSREGANARRTIDRILSLDPPLTSAEAGEYQNAVSYLDREIARKKLVTPAEGEVNSAPTFQPNPNDPQTATPEFREFFEGSQMVDSSGTPVTFFTGVTDTEGLIQGRTDLTVGRFDTDESGSFFSDRREVAQRYANGENDSSQPPSGSVGSVQEVYLNFKNPLVLDAKGASFLDIAKSIRFEGNDLHENIIDIDPNIKTLLSAQKNFDVLDQSKLYIGNVKPVAQSLGYDGAIVKNVDDIGGVQTQYIAFEPTQIKSATDNSGVFDSSNPNFRESRTAAPAQNVRQTQGSTGSARAPLSTGLLPDTDIDAQQVQSFNTQGVQDVVDQITTDWKKVPKIGIVETTVALPENVRPTDGALLGGVTDGATAYLVADQLTSPAHIESVLREELFHKGLMKSLGGNYDPQLARVFRKRGGVNGLLKLGTRYNIPSNFTSLYQDVIAAAQSGDRDAQLELTDEVMARVAQSPELPSGLKADIKTIAAKIKRYLKQFFPDSWFDTVTDADLLLMIREANAAGREEGSQVNRVRQSRVRPGDYRGVNAAGEQVIFNYLDNTERPETTGVQDQLQGIKNYWTDTYNTARSNRLGQTIYRSTPWQGLQKRLSDARIGLARHENEYKLLNEPQVGEIFNAVNGLDLPPLLSNIVSGLNPSLQNSFMSLHSAVSTYSAQADYAAKVDLKVNDAGETLFQVMERNNNAYADYAAALNLTPTAAKQSITRYLNALHASERNEVAWIKNGPIEAEAGRERAALFQQVSDGTLSMREALDQSRVLMDDNAEGNRADFKGSGMTDAEAAQIIQQMEGVPGAQPLLQNAAEATYEVIAATNEIKRQTGSYSKSFQEAIEAYGWTNYVPLRGRGVDLDDSDDTFISHYADNVFASTYRPFQGRESLTEDVFENVQQIAVSAIEQYAAQDFIKKVAVHAVAADQTSEYKQAFERDGSNGQLLAGNVEQVEINSPEFKRLMATKDRNRLVYYDPNNANKPLQEALVITLNNSEGTDAVLGAKSVGADRLDNLLRESFTVGGFGIADVTQTTASLKTWRNLPFIPFDALRNTLTLGYVSATEGGVKGFRDYVNAMTEPGLGNYGKDIFRYTQLYGTNQFDKIQELVQQEGPNSTIAELDEFFRLGGPTTQLAALRETPPGSVESLTKFGGIGDQKLLKAADSILVPLNAAADTLSRFAFYKSLQDQGIPKDVAAGRAKNTANFEQRGTWSGPLGAAFEFARATSVGASALINSTLTGKYGKETAAAAFGAGAMMYMTASLFAGVDDEGDDNQGKINGKLFNNNFVMQFGDSEKDRVQFGIGFGPIAASMSAGMQAARWMLGHQSMGNTFDNITSGIANQYQVMPTSGISPLADPIGFAANTAVPSILKPLYEVSTNMTGLGIPVRSEYPGAGSGDLTESFEGRYNSEQEMYEQMTQALSNAGLAEINPDNLRHVMRAYGGTITHMLESAFENIKYVTGDEEYAYNKKAGFYFLRNFIGSDFSQMPSDFYEHYGRMAQLDKRVKGFEERGELDKAAAIKDNPFYADNIGSYKQTESRRTEINKEHRPVFRFGATSLAEKRNTQELRDAQLRQLYKDYLDIARD